MSIAGSKWQLAQPGSRSLPPCLPCPGAGERSHRFPVTLAQDPGGAGSLPGLTGSPHIPIKYVESSPGGSFCMTAKGFPGDAEMGGCYLLKY